MQKKKFIIGCYKDEETLFSAIEELQEQKHKIHDVFTPYPVHGLDHKLKMRQTKLHIAGFIYGMIGTITAFTFMSWVFNVSWPINFGGKPFLSVPAFIPIIFEVTVLFASVGMVLTFCYLCKIAPFVRKDIFHIRATDDLLVMAVELQSKEESEKVNKILNNHSPAEVKEKEIEQREWWFGVFSTKKMLFQKN